MDLASLGVGLVGLVLSAAALFNESLALGIIGLALVVISIGALYFLYYSAKNLEETNRSLKETNRSLKEANRSLEEARSFLEEPPFTLLSVEKTLTFNEKDPRVASHVDIREARANYKGLTELWFKEVGPERNVDNVLIDSEEPDFEYTEEGKKSVCRRHPFKHYPDGLGWRDEIRSTLTLDIVDAFPDSREYYTHKVMDKTEKLRVRVKFHPEKRPYRVWVCTGAGGPPWEEIKPSPLRNHGQEWSLTIENPEWGKHYRVQWEW